MCFRSGEARTSPIVIDTPLQIRIAQILARDDLHQRVAHQFGRAQLALRRRRRPHDLCDLRFMSLRRVGE